MTVDFLFADDSVQTGNRSGMGKVVAFGGVILESQHLRPLTDAIEALCQRWSVPKGTEIKWSPPVGNWIRENLKEGRGEFNAELLQVADEFEPRALVVAWDTGRTSLKGDEAFQKCVQFLFERATTHLAKRDASCVMVADRPGGGRPQDDEFLRRFLERVEAGTEYAQPDRFLLNALTTPSHLVRHLQLADMVVGVTTAMVAGRYTYAQPLFERVKPWMIANHLGYRGGTGLKLFPDELMNLYHWVLGEDSYTKVADQRAIALPDIGRPYSVEA